MSLEVAENNEGTEESAVTDFKTVSVCVLTSCNWLLNN